MVRLRHQTGRLILVAVMLLSRSALAGGPGCTKGSVTLQEQRSQKGQLALDVPAAWNCDLRDLADGLVITDVDGRCTLEVLRSPGLLSLARTVTLYESLYLGSNDLDDDCAKEVRQAIDWAEDSLVRQYTPRTGGRTVQALFARLDGKIIVGLLKCEPADGLEADWGMATSIFRSYRKLSAVPVAWSAGSGLFGSLYFLMKIPFNQFQNPD